MMDSRDRSRGSTTTDLTSCLRAYFYKARAPTPLAKALLGEGRASLSVNVQVAWSEKRYILAHRHSRYKLIAKYFLHAKRHPYEHGILVIH